MDIRKTIRNPFTCISIVILASCSKTDHATITPGVIPNTFTYTVTDTTGVNYTFSDSSLLIPDSNEYNIISYGGPISTPAAEIFAPDTGNNHLITFHFEDYKSHGHNSLSFSLPYFQASLSGVATLLKPPVDLQMERIFYDAVQPEPPFIPSLTVYLSSFRISTNISDSTGGFVTGSFSISATTLDSGKIQINGNFAHLPGNFK